MLALAQAEEDDHHVGDASMVRAGGGSDGRVGMSSRGMERLMKVERVGRGRGGVSGAGAGTGVGASTYEDPNQGEVDAAGVDQG